MNEHVPCNDQGLKKDRIVVKFLVILQTHFSNFELEHSIFYVNKL